MRVAYIKEKRVSSVEMYPNHMEEIEERDLTSAFEAVGERATPATRSLI